MRKTIPVATSLTPAQLKRLREWGGERSLTEPADMLRAALRIAVPDLPPDPPPHGGYRVRWPRAGETAVLKADWRKNDRQAYRAGTTCVVERTTRHGALVSFGDVYPLEDTLQGADVQSPGAWVNAHYSAYAFLPRAALTLSE